jgi:outer membrane immunogenic protein
MLTGGRTFVAAVVLGMASVGGAIAADLRVAPVYKAAPVATTYNWTGFYVGAFVGGLWGNKDWFEVVGPVPGGIIRPSYSGVIGGATVGFNYQVSSWVFGVEGDWGWTNASGSTGCIANAANTCGVNLYWAATLAGRVGYAFDRTLLYGKAGGVWVREDYPVAPGTPFAITLRQTRSGWMAGGGVEHAFTQSWSAKLEYNYLGLGTDRLNFGGAIEDITQRAHVVKVGINYRFGVMTP